jgi:RNA polymerase sigma-70 factor (ECF subfamily)
MPSPLDPENWVKEHSDYLFSFALSRLLNKDDALDLVQETFFSALKAAHSFKGESSERTWLTAILKRKIIDHYRKKSSNKENFLGSIHDRDGRFQEDGRAEGHWKKEFAPQSWLVENNTIEEEEFQRIFTGCLSFLPSTWAAVFTFKIMEELSTEDVCKELNISSSNVWTIIHRAKLQLRECITKNWFEKKKRL